MDSGKAINTLSTWVCRSHQIKWDDHATLPDDSHTVEWLGKRSGAQWIILSIMELRHFGNSSSIDIRISSTTGNKESHGNSEVLMEIGKALTNG